MMEAGRSLQANAADRNDGDVWDANEEKESLEVARRVNVEIMIMSRWDLMGECQDSWCTKKTTCEHEIQLV
jgi:hypothetical protein